MTCCHAPAKMALQMAVLPTQCRQTIREIERL